MTCGLTRSCSFASWKVVCTPCALICENGMSVPWLMRASRLSSVRMRGLETMRSMPLDSAAERRTREVDVVVDRAEREAERTALPGADGGREVDGEVRVRDAALEGREAAVGVFWS